MVDFYEVHGKAVEQAKGHVRSGDIWNVAMRETLPLPSAAKTAMEGTVAIVRFRAMPDGRLEPATPRDKHEISQWNARHRNTSRESFRLPAELPRSP